MNHSYVLTGVRPACNLALSEALFASPAVGGKVSGAVGAGALTAVGSRTVNEWKLTMPDSNNRRCDFYAGSFTAVPGGIKNVPYQIYCYENPGINEYLSAIITKDDYNALYYGRLKQITSDKNVITDSMDITIPSDLPAGSYTLKLFMQQCNGDYKSDYASEFSDIQLTVLPVVTKVNVPASRTYKAGDTLDFTVSFNDPVTVDIAYAAPSLPLTIGSKQAEAGYVSGSGSNLLTFQYTVASDDSDSDGIALGNSIKLNGGMIQYGPTAVQLTLNNAASTTGVLVDTTAPEVASITPGNVAADVPTGGNMEITFSEAMSSAAGTVTLSVDGGSPKNLAGGSWINNKTYRIPYSGLDCSTEYTVTVGGFKDAVGNGMESGHTGSFTTEARPAVLSVTPAKGATNVLTSGSLTVTFGRAMATGHGTVSLNGETLTGGSFRNDRGQGQ